MGGAFRQYPSKDKDLLKAIRENDDRLFLDALVKRKANVNRSFDYGWTPLHWASFKGRLTMVETLIDRGAKSVKNNDKNYPIDICYYDAEPNPIERAKIMAVLKQGSVPTGTDGTNTPQQGEVKEH